MSANSERVKRWRNRNRALHNLRRRNARKKFGLGEKEAAIESNRSRTEMARNEMLGSVVARGDVAAGEKRLADAPCVSNGGAAKAGYNPPPQVHANDVVKSVNKDTKLSELRELIEEESQKLPETSVEARPVVYRNDYGGVISKFAWEKLQRLKAHAKANNFEMDEYSQ